MPSKNTPVPTQSLTTPSARTPIPVAAAIPLVQHHMEMHNAFAVGADCVNRISTMIDAALEIAKGSALPAVRIHLLTKFLKECQNLSEGLAGVLECERDDHLACAALEEK